MMDFTVDIVQRMVKYLYTGFMDPPPPEDMNSFERLMQQMGLPSSDAEAAESAKDAQNFNNGKCQFRFKYQEYRIGMTTLTESRRKRNSIKTCYICFLLVYYGTLSNYALSQDDFSGEGNCNYLVAATSLQYLLNVYKDIQFSNLDLEHSNLAFYWLNC